MAQATAIEWTDLSWNPVHGCSKVSPGCAHCYAETLSLRRGHTALPWTPENAAENVQLKPHKLREPLSNAKAWRGLGPAAAAAGKTDGMLVFVNSTSDLFHENVPPAYIAKVFAVMARAKRHTFQILTKRPERMRDVLSDVFFRGEVGAYLEPDGLPLPVEPWPLPNVWLGTSIENRRFVGRADALRDTPAAVRFISAEPLLGPLIRDGGYVWPRGVAPPPDAILPGEAWADGYDGPELDLTGVDWLIVGGESGAQHRPMRAEWVRDLRDACLVQRDICQVCGGFGALDTMGGPAHEQTDAVAPCPARHTAFFLKQLGGRRPGGALDDLPEDLRIRTFPTPVPA